MHRLLNRSSANAILLLALFCFIVSFPISPVSGAKSAATQIEHKTIDYFVPGHRITMNLDVQDEKGVSLVRCYFKAKEEADFVFVPMENTEKIAFSGVLPAPGVNNAAIEYLFLVVNGANEVVKTQLFTVTADADKKVPKWQKVDLDQEMAVYTEISNAQPPAGFSDSIAMNVVESSARFGLVAGGLYAGSQSAAAGAGAGAAAAGGSAGTATTAGAVTGTAASATSAGTVAAATTAGVGLSTATVVGAAAVAVGAGAAAASSSGGGDDSSSTSVASPDTSTNTTPGTVTNSCAQYDGLWAGTYNGRDCNVPTSGQWQMTCSACLCTVGVDDGYGPDGGTISGNTVTLSGAGGTCGTVTAVGTFSGASVSGTWSDQLGGAGSWSGTKIQ